MLDSRFIEFKLDYTKTKDVPIGSVVSSDDIAASGHRWRVICYPRGCRKEDAGEHLSLYLQLVSTNSKNVTAIFDAFMMASDGTPSWCDARRHVHLYPAQCALHGWRRFVSRSYLDSLYVAADGLVTVMCGVIVDDPPPPPSDMGAQLGRLLDCGDGSDVSFVVGGEAFPAHRVVLAARSPVFKAHLLGAMADTTTPSITLHDIAPETFRVMLRFVYTDALPVDEEIGDSKIETMRRLLAAADRYALDRLKVLCALKLGDNVSVDTVAATLACAETYNCLQLKKKCIAFLADEKNLEAAMLTDGFVQLLQQCPLTLATFEFMLQAMYPDIFAMDNEIGHSPTKIFEGLLAIADHHGLHRLKLACAQILWDNVSVDTVAPTLACAEMCSCPELKRKCIEFFAAKKNFKKAVLTKGLVKLGQRFPSVIDELRERVGL